MRLSAVAAGPRSSSASRSTLWRSMPSSTRSRRAACEDSKWRVAGGWLTACWYWQFGLCSLGCEPKDSQGCLGGLTGPPEWAPHQPAMWLAHSTVQHQSQDTHLLVASTHCGCTKALQKLLLLRGSPLVSCQHQLQGCVARRIDVSCQVCCCRLLLRRSGNDVASSSAAAAVCSCNRRPRHGGGRGMAAWRRSGASGRSSGPGAALNARAECKHPQVMCTML